MSVNPRERDFTQLGKLGNGNFGEVHRVRRKSDGVEFALKKSNLSHLPPNERTREATTWRRLEHPNIVRLHDWWLGTDNAHLFLLMDLVVTEKDKRLVSCTLGTYLVAGESLSDETLKDLCGKLLDALCVFEDNHIMHNDLKPENIFLTRDGAPKIGDMGFAMFTEGPGSIIQCRAKGTPLFTSPEVLHLWPPYDRNVQDVPRRGRSYESDVYSLGTLLWTLKMGSNFDTPGQLLPVYSDVFRDRQLRDCLKDMLQRDAQKRLRPKALKAKHFAPFAAAPIALPTPPRPSPGPPSPPIVMPAPTSKVCCVNQP